MKLSVYREIYSVNAGFEQVLRGLKALRKHDAFHRRELKRFRALSREARAATNSYFAGIVEQHETEEAGRLSSKRYEREQLDEAGASVG